MVCWMLPSSHSFVLAMWPPQFYFRVFIYLIMSWTLVPYPIIRLLVFECWLMWLVFKIVILTRFLLIKTCYKLGCSLWTILDSLVGNGKCKLFQEKSHLSEVTILNSVLCGLKKQLTEKYSDKFIDRTLKNLWLY